MSLYQSLIESDEVQFALLVVVRICQFLIVIKLGADGVAVIIGFILFFSLLTWMVWSHLHVRFGDEFIMDHS